MKYKYEKVSIENYKSIKKLENFELRGLNVLIGANGAGKSNFLHFISNDSDVAFCNLDPDDYIFDLGFLLAFIYGRHYPYYKRIVDTIQLIAPYFHDFVNHDELEWLHKNDIDTPLEAHMLSGGTLHFMYMTTLLLQPPEYLPDIILLENPESGLHPYAIHILAGIFKQLAAEKQLIIATQSVELINELEAEDVIVVENIDGASTFKRLDQKELSGWLEEYSLGDLWKRNILGGRP